MPHSLTELVGNTPLVALDRMCPKAGVRLFGKLEGNNPGGSVKDRAALSMIEGAERRGELSAGVRIIEPTSGNTGIALAMIACAKGYEIELVMPENATLERVQTMRAYGATVTLTSQEGGMEGAIDYAREQVAGGKAIMLDQFKNPDNPAAHQHTTGPEIWRDTHGEITHFVSAMGTTGTIMGCTQFFAKMAPHVHVVGVHPAEGAQIPGIRAWPVEYQPAFFEPERLTSIVRVSQTNAEETARRMARVEGVFGGISSGGAVWAALQIAEQIATGTIVVIICDRGDRYLSSGLFDSSDTSATKRGGHLV